MPPNFKVTLLTLIPVLCICGSALSSEVRYKKIQSNTV